MHGHLKPAPPDVSFTFFLLLIQRNLIFHSFHTKASKNTSLPTKLLGRDKINCTKMLGPGSAAKHEVGSGVAGAALLLSVPCVTPFCGLGPVSGN